LTGSRPAVVRDKNAALAWAGIGDVSIDAIGDAALATACIKSPFAGAFRTRGPIGAGRGHDPPGLIGEPVPSLAAMVDEIDVGFEDAFESQLSRMNCQTFSTGLSSGRLGGKAMMAM
jgi:hypothetical protein